MTQLLFPILLAVLVSVTSMDGQHLTDIGSVCNPALAKDLTATIKTQQQDLDYLYLVDEHTFDAAQSSGSFGISLPIADDLLKLNAKWKDFKTHRADYFKAIHYTSNTSAVDFSHMEITSPLAYPAWSSCIQTLADKNKDGGLFAWKEREDGNSISIHIYYKVPEIAQHKYHRVPLLGKVRYADSEQESFFGPKQKIDSEQTIFISVVRKKVNGVPQPVDVTISAGEYGASLFSDWKISPPSATYVTSVEHKSTDCPLKLFGDLKYEKQDNNKAHVIGTCSPSGRITEVSFGGCVGGLSCGHVWPLNHLISSDKTSATFWFATDHGGPENPVLYEKLSYDVDMTTCIGTDSKTNGSGCPVRTPSDIFSNK